MAWFDTREIRGIALFVPLMLLVGVGWFIVDLRRMDHRAARLQEAEKPLSSDSVQLFCFDPNTIGYDSLKLLGFSKSQARQLLHYRAAGKIYRMAEDLDGIYGMTDTLFQRIRPYVHIGEAYRLHPQEHPEWEGRKTAPRTFQPPATPLPIDSIQVETLRAMGFSIRWSKAFVDCHRRRGIRSVEEMSELNFIGDSIAALLAPWISFLRPKPTPLRNP